MAASEKPPVQAADGAPLLLRSMRFYNRLLHVFLGFSLIVASLLALWMFFYDVYSILFLGRGLLEGFLHALGTLLILWTISELISTEVRYLGGQRVQVAVFVDVAIAATLRKLLIGDIEGDGIEVKLVHLAALVALGLLRWLLTVGVQRAEKEEAPATDRRGQTPTPPTATR